MLSGCFYVIQLFLCYPAVSMVFSCLYGDWYKNGNGSNVDIQGCFTVCNIGFCPSKGQSYIQLRFGKGSGTVISQDKGVSLVLGIFVVPSEYLPSLCKSPKVL